MFPFFLFHTKPKSELRLLIPCISLFLRLKGEKNGLRMVGQMHSLSVWDYCVFTVQKQGRGGSKSVRTTLKTMNELNK